MALRPDFARALSPAIAESAREAASFLADAQALADALGRPRAAGDFAREAEEELRRYANDLVTEIRAAEGEERAAAKRLMAQVLSIASPLLDEDETGLLKERAAAAAVTA